MWVKPVTLQGKHATIRPMEKEDLDQLFEVSLHKEIWSYMPMEVTCKADMERLINQALERKEQGIDLPLVIQDNRNKKLIGSTRFLDISEASRNLEIGWTWLTPEVWRTPINTECKYLLLKHCFETLKTIRVQLKTDGRNTRSQNAIERIGGVREGTLRKSRMTYTGFVRDTVYFSILDDEWPNVKNNLEQRLNRK